MTLLLDTSILIDIEKKKQSTLDQLESIYKLNPDYPRITFINLFEFMRGLKERKKENIANSLEFVSQYQVIQTSTKTAPILAELKYAYDKKGISLSLSDLLIAALAIEHGFIVVTKDKDFNSISEVKKIVLH